MTVCDNDIVMVPLCDCAYGTPRHLRLPPPRAPTGVSKQAGLPVGVRVVKVDGKPVSSKKEIG